MADLKAWETLAALIAGTRASVCGTDALVFSSSQAAASDGKPVCTRIVKVVSKNRKGEAAGIWGCLTAGLFGGSAAPGSSNAVRVCSLMSSPDDVKPVSVRADSTIHLNEPQITPAQIGAVLAAVWDHSRALWMPMDSQRLLAAPGLEGTLPLSIPMSVCFKVCVEVAARIARPLHVVSNTVRSPKGGSAVLQPRGFALSNIMVLNISVEGSVVVITGKREKMRAIRVARNIADNLAVMDGDRGWRRLPGSPSPLKPGAVELALFTIIQGSIEVIQKQP